jgi:hypothetical protein
MAFLLVLERLSLERAVFLHDVFSTATRAGAYRRQSEINAAIARVPGAT